MVVGLRLCASSALPRPHFSYLLSYLVVHIVHTPGLCYRGWRLTLASQALSWSKTKKVRIEGHQIPVAVSMGNLVTATLNVSWLVLSLEE
jgi:hypothetical protein